jgi:hypothetical protein
MTSSSPQHLSVVLTAAQRDGARGFIVEDLLGVDGNALSEGGDLETKIRPALRRLSVGVRAVDQLGWEVQGDREVYVLEVDGTIARYMAEMAYEARDNECAKDAAAIEAAAVVAAAFEGEVA